MSITMKQSYLLGTSPPELPIVAPAILRKRVMTSQPQYAAQIDWGNQITKDLVFCAVPSGSTAIDLVTGVIGTPGGTGVISSIASRNGGTSRCDAGRVTKSDGSANSRILWPVSSTLYGAKMANSATILCLGGSNAWVDGNGYSIAGNASISNGDGYGLGMDSYLLSGRGGVIKTRYSQVNSSGTESFYPLGNPAGNMIHFFGYCTENNGVSGNWYGARRSVSFSGKTAHGTSVVNRQTAIHSTCGYSTTASNTFSLLTLFWNRALSPAEYASLYDNPYQIFLAPNAQPWVATP